MRLLKQVRDFLAALLIALIAASLWPYSLHARATEPPPSEEVVVVSVDGQLTDANEEVAWALASAFHAEGDASHSNVVELDSATTEELIQALISAGGTPVEHPVDENGKPIPPPLKLPPGREGQENEWKSVPGTPQRPIKWVPKHPISNPGGGQPGGSWDPENGHWDVDDGNGNRTRLLPDGTIVDHGNDPLPDQSVPAPFPALDPDIIAQFAAIGIVAVVIVTVAWIIFGLWWGAGAAAASAVDHRESVRELVSSHSELSFVIWSRHAA